MNSHVSGKTCKQTVKRQLLLPEECDSAGMHTSFSAFAITPCALFPIKINMELKLL
jgi:hypothetical protein